MTQPESRRSRTIMKHLRLHGAFCFKVWGSEHMLSGLPDVVGCYKGLFFAFEVKNPESRDNVSERQSFVMSQIVKAGGITQVVVTKEEALQALLEACG